jgi:hypothetical protein
MKYLALAALIPLCFAGTRPRQSPTDYRAQETVGDVTVAAEILPPNQVRNVFSTDLNKYIVVEVAVYPKDGTTVDVSKMDFALKLGSGQTVRAANPAAIGPKRQQTSPQPPGRTSPVDVYTTAGVGYESGTDRNGQNRKGVYTETGVAVAVGEPRYPPPPTYPPSTVQQDIEDYALPEGATSKVVAGFLYFPASFKKNVTYDLEYHSQQGLARLNLK